MGLTLPDVVPRAPSLLDPWQGLFLMSHPDDTICRSFKLDLDDELFVGLIHLVPKLQDGVA